MKMFGQIAGITHISADDREITAYATENDFHLEAMYEEWMRSDLITNPLFMYWCRIDRVTEIYESSIQLQPPTLSQTRIQKLTLEDRAFENLQILKQHTWCTDLSKKRCSFDL